MSTLTPNIWQMQARRDTEGLIEALSHADPGVRKRAATALRILDTLEAIPALQAALAIEEDWQAQASLQTALQHLTRDNQLAALIHAQDTDGLVNLLYSTNLEDVLGAAEALGSLGDQTTIEHLVALFRNPVMPDDVRLAAAESLIKLKSAPGVVTLLAALRRDEWQVRRNAAAILGQLRATWATRPLIAALEDENAIVQRTALAALRNMDTPLARRAVEEIESAGEEEPDLPPAEPVALDEDDDEDESAGEPIGEQAAAPDAPDEEDESAAPHDPAA
ncbi:MAG: HEAT repeat domain-containing protein [Anaerolineae bacterium]|nr:HEAT repeat domain-containing protein [Anaerolineae bacterium]